MEGKELFRSESGDVVIEVESRTIEFWRGEYAKRHIFIKEGENYPVVRKAMKALKFTGRKMEEVFSKSSDIDDSTYEYFVLVCIDQNRIEDLHLEKIVPVQSLEKLKNKLIQAHDFSEKYGYVISDLYLGDNISNRKFELLHVIQNTDESYWQDTIIENIPKRFGLNITKEITIPRFYGMNAKPHHRTHTLEPSLLETCNSYEINPDIAFAVKNIDDDYFNIAATIGKIEYELCDLRLDKLEAKIEVTLKKIQKLISSTPTPQIDLKEICSELRNLSDYELFKTITHANNYKKEEKERYDKYLIIISSSISAKSINEIKDLFPFFRDLTKEMDMLIKRQAKAMKKQYSGPFSGKNAEVARAKGLFMWDLCYLEGLTREESLKEMMRIIKKCKSELLNNDNPSKDKKYGRLDTTELCIEKNAFLPILST